MQGQTTYNLITPLQTNIMPIDDVKTAVKEGAEPIYTSHVDLTVGLHKLDQLGHHKMLNAQSIVHTLYPGQCIYIPAGWWYQVEKSNEDTSTVVTFWYDMKSSWLSMLFEGI